MGRKYPKRRAHRQENLVFWPFGAESFRICAAEGENWQEKEGSVGRKNLISGREKVIIMPYGRDLPGIFGGGRRQKDEEKGAFGPKRSTARIYAREKIRRKYLLQAAARGVSQAAGTCGPELPRAPSSMPRLTRSAASHSGRSSAPRTAWTPPGNSTESGPERAAWLRRERRFVQQTRLNQVRSVV